MTHSLADSNSDAAGLHALRRLVEARGYLPAPEVCRQVRIDSGVSQLELGAAIGASGATISLWESGKRIPAGRYRERYVEAIRLLQDASREGQVA